MSQIVRLFTNGRSQAVRLPTAFRFDTREVYIRQDPETGDVILSRKPADWKEFRELSHPQGQSLCFDLSEPKSYA
jgi:antitoxin VapB